MLRPTLYSLYGDKDLLYLYKTGNRDTRDFNEIIDAVAASKYELFGIFIDPFVYISHDDIIELVKTASEKTGLVLKYFNAGCEEVLSEILEMSKHQQLHIDSTLYEIVARNIMTRVVLPAYLHIGIRDTDGARIIADAVKHRNIDSIAITTTSSLSICEFMRHCGNIRSLNIIFTNATNYWNAKKISELLDTSLVDMIVNASLETFGIGFDGILLTHDDSDIVALFKRILSCASMRKFNIGENVSDGTMKNIIDAIIDARQLTDIVFNSNVHDREILRLIIGTNLRSITFNEIDVVYNDTKYSDDIRREMRANSSLIVRGLGDY